MRSIQTTTMAFILFSFLIAFIDKVLILLANQGPEVSNTAALFLKAALPGIFF